MLCPAFLKPPQEQQRNRQAVVGLHEVGEDPDRSPEMGQRVFESTLNVGGMSQVEMGFGLVRPVLQRLVKQLYRFVYATLASNFRSAVYVGFGCEDVLHKESLNVQQIDHKSCLLRVTV
jgi:hypothetical protein